MYLREDGTPYYVGKFSHLKRVFEKTTHNVPVPKDRTFILTQEFPSEVDVIAAEIFLIAYYGRKDKGTGLLRNLTDGGEGACGYIPSNETRRKLSVACSNPSAETRARMSASQKANTNVNRFACHLDCLL